MQEFWAKRWEEQQTAFHEGRANELLAAHVGRLAGRRRVLVPLAGKAEDLRFLAARGHEVVGVEFVQTAVDAFFREQGLDAREHRRPIGPHEAFSFGPVTMICEDVFRLAPETIGTFDAVYDRAALVALKPSTRERYVATCRALLAEDGPTMLVALSYDKPVEGPPWSLDREMVSALFAGRTIDVLATRDVPAAPGLVAKGVTAVQETAYLIGR